MNNSLRVFDNEEFGTIRTVMIDGEPWFVGKDVAEALGYTNPRDALSKHVDDEDKKTVAIRDGIRGNPNVTVINESGVYSLILSSKLPNAKKFKRWVTADILPTIRKHGAYIEPQTLENMIASPEFGIRLLTELKEEKDRRLSLESTVEAMQPKALFAAAVSASNSSILVGVLAKILKQNGYKTGQNRFFEELRNDGWLISQEGSNWNMPTQKSMERGLFEIKETTVTHPDGHISISKTVKVTGKGQVFFIDYYLHGGKEKSKRKSSSPRPMIAAQNPSAIYGGM